MTMINTRRNSRAAACPSRIDPTVVREPIKPSPPCLACASASRVAKHTH